MHLDEKEKLREFVREQLRFSKKDVDFSDDTQLLTSRMLDSLALVDLVLFLEENYPNVKIEMEKIKREDFDSINKIWEMVNAK